MKDILIRVRIDHAAAVKAGFSLAGETVVPIPANLTSEQRETLLTVPYRGRTSTPDVYAYELTKDGVRSLEGTASYGGVEPRLPDVPDASPESIAMLLDAWPSAVSDYRAQVTAKFTKQIEQDIARGFFRTDGFTVEKYADADLAARWKAGRDAKEAARHEREQAEREKREAEKRAVENARAKEEKERLDWIAAHGSPRLHRLVKENIEYKAVYRDERLAVDRPGWMWDWDNDFEEARNAPEAALDLLDKARATIPGQAVWLRYVISRDEETGDKRRSYVALGQFLGKSIVFEEAVEADRAEAE